MQKQVSIQRFYSGLVVIILLLVLYVLWSLNSAIDDWGKGLGGVELVNQWEKCSIYPPGSPWVAAIPHRTFNFITGSHQCSSVRQFSTLEHGVLTLDCPEEVTIVENPDFMSMRTDEFVILETGMHPWMNETATWQKKYTVAGDAILRPQSEWFQVFCQGDENYHVQNVKNETVAHRLEEEGSEPRLNLVMFMMDTVSRAQLFRKMYQTVEQLEHLNNTDTNEVFQFFRLHTVGFSTEQNTKAMYTGTQLRRERRGKPYWHMFRDQGYATLYLNGFCEDWMNTFLKIKSEGMDHLAIFPWCHFDYHPLEKTFGNFAGPFSMARRCIQGEYVHNRIFSYLNDYWYNYEGYGRQAHIPLQEGHEGSGDVVMTLDPDLANFLKDWEEQGRLNDTVIILTSDHGSHMGPYFISGDMGEFEQKLPFFYIIFPKWFMDKYPDFRKNLHANEQNLIVHYDIHWTIRHLLSLPEFGGPREHVWPVVDTWECEANLPYMQIAAGYAGKRFKRKWYEREMRQMHKLIKNCLEENDLQPIVEPVDLEKILDTEENEETRDKVAVEDVIQDVNTWHWIEDAYFYKSRQNMRNKKECPGDTSELEDNTWTTHKSPGCGRYKFGWSLMEYAEPRQCSEVGINACICSAGRGSPTEFRGSPPDS